MMVKSKFLAAIATMAMAYSSAYAQAKQPSAVEFPKFLKSGGVNRYLSSHVRYPKKGLKLYWQGQSIIKFLITSTGKVDSAFVQKSSFPEFDAEALRVVNTMPDWKPVIENGKPVNCWFTLPVTFKFSKARLDCVVQDILTNEIFVTDGTVIPVNPKDKVLDLTVTEHGGRYSQRMERSKVKYVRVDSMELKDSTNFVALDNGEDKFYIKKDENRYSLIKEGMCYIIRNHYDEFLEAISYFPKSGPNDKTTYCSLPFFRQGDKYYFAGKLYKKVD